MTKTSSWLLLAFLCGCNTAAAEPEAKSREEEPLGDVALQIVREEEVPRYVTLVGTLRANREADVAADASGRVVMATGERGERIKKGTVIARLDADAAAFAADEAKEVAAATRVQTEQATRDCERAERLYAKNAISASEHERMTASCQANVHNVSAANARMRRASKSVSDSIIRAPFNGVISERYVELGEHVAPGTRIMTIVDLDKMKLELKVPESSVGALEDGGTIAFVVPSLGEERFSAELDHFAPSLSAVSRDLIVEASVTGPAGKLRPGMFVTAYLVESRVKLPVVPAAALSGTGPSRRVFVVKEGQLEERVVLVGDTMGSNVAIESGLAAGEQIASVAKAELRDGAKLASN
jgi:membrane fusion protein, multidrug efflux system